MAWTLVSAFAATGPYVVKDTTVIRMGGQTFSPSSCNFDGERGGGRERRMMLMMTMMTRSL
jgi:hypothetical protein